MEMFIKSLVLGGMLFLGACAPGQFMDRHNGKTVEMSNGNFEYGGCHIVNEHATAMVAGLSPHLSGNRIFWKQRHSDGTSSKDEINGKPC